MPNLTVAKVKAAGPGKHQDGQGLYLRVTSAGSKSWVLRITVDGRRRDIGLGGWPGVSLVDARRKAFEHRSAVADGRNPLVEKRRSDAPAFRDAAQAVYDANRPRWRSDRHAKLWWASLENHVFPVIGDMRVDRITQSDVHRCVEPIWTTRPEAAPSVGHTEQPSNHASHHAKTDRSQPVETPASARSDRSQTPKPRPKRPRPAALAPQSPHTPTHPHARSHYPTPNSPMVQPCPANTTAATPEREMSPHLAGRRPDSPLAEYRRTDATLPGRRPANPESGEHRQPSRAQQQPEPDQPQRQIKYQPDPRTTPEPVTIEPTQGLSAKAQPAANSEQGQRYTLAL